MRVARPADHECALCRLTYGARGMDQRWRRFTRSLGLPVTFLHRDEFRERVRHLPAARRGAAGRASSRTAGRWCRSSRPAQMRAAADLDRLMDAVTEGLLRADKLQ